MFINQNQHSTNHSERFLHIIIIVVIFNNSFDPPVDSLGSANSDTSSPTSLSVSEHASTIKSEPNMAPSPYAGQTVASATQVNLLFIQMPYRCVKYVANKHFIVSFSLRIADDLNVLHIHEVAF